MIEESSSNLPSSHTHESNQARKERIEKKKIIRKQQVKERKRSALESMEEQPMTREQKRELQKEKNRIAAQMSRDNRKKYIEDLEKRVNDLETQIQQQICSKCGISLVEQAQEELPDPMNMLEDDQPIFMRRRSSTDSLNSINMFFVIAMVAIAVFSFTGSVMMAEGGESSDVRILHPIVPYVQTYPQQIFPQPQISVKAEEGALIEIGKNMEIETGPTNGKQCFYDFLKVNEPKTGLYTNEFEDRSVILCREPQIFPKIHKESETRTSLLGEEMTLFLNGPQVRELEQNSNVISENEYTLEGIYRMELQIKGLQKIFGNCLN